MYFPPFCLFLQMYPLHNHKQYTKRKVILFSTTLVYHLHVEKRDLRVENLKKLNPWRPSWKMATTAGKPQNQAWQTKYSCSVTQNPEEKVFTNFSSKMPYTLLLATFL